MIHADETGVRVQGKLQWLHVLADPMHTLYAVHPKRGTQAIEAQNILPGYQGTLVHDCWKPYWKLQCKHALCNAHLLRELRYIQELTQQQWPAKMAALLLLALKITQVAHNSAEPLTSKNINDVNDAYQAILYEGELVHPPSPGGSGRRGRVKQSAAFNLLRRLRQHADAVLLFIREPTVPFTNNVAERAVRMPKVKQKISGCFRSLKGAEDFGVIRSCLDTLRKQGHCMLHVLRQAFQGNPVPILSAE